LLPPFPINVAIPDIADLGTQVKSRMATLDHAYDLGVGAVVFYLGRVDMPDQTRGFCGLYRSGKIAEEEGLAFREGQKRIRKASNEKTLDAVLLSLEGLKGQVRPFLKPSIIKILVVNRKVERKELLEGIKLLVRAIFKNDQKDRLHLLKDPMDEFPKTPWVIILQGYPRPLPYGAIVPL
jgi:hypothetical protein